MAIGWNDFKSNEDLRVQLPPRSYGGRYGLKVRKSLLGAVEIRRPMHWDQLGEDMMHYTRYQAELSQASGGLPGALE